MQNKDVLSSARQYLTAAGIFSLLVFLLVFQNSRLNQIRCRIARLEKRLEQAGRAREDLEKKHNAIINSSAIPGIISSLELKHIGSSRRLRLLCGSISQGKEKENPRFAFLTKFNFKHN
ncbi:MAG TPA: hypothetical protein DC049_13235 [Spirochaetia bacterium]|nr:hypothetical protein [Spirochaetia bacterium]